MTLVRPIICFITNIDILHFPLLDSVNMNTGNGRRRRRSEDLLDFDKLEETLTDLHWNYSNVVRRIEHLF